MKSHSYFSIAIFLILFLFIPQPALSQINPGVLIFHEASESIVYAWFSYVPPNMCKTFLNHILISGQNGNIMSNDYNELIEECRNQTQWRKNWADNYNYIVLTPVIPRHIDPHIYSVVFDLNCFLDSHIVTGQTIAPFDQRPDLKVNLMIDELTKTLRAYGYNVDDKVFIEGFSAGAMFAQRYCLLHPERVRAIAAGQCGGSLTVPGAKFNAADMDWPVGVNDFQFLIGSGFDLSEYRQIPQFIYIGDQDTTSSTVYWTFDYGGIFTQLQIDFLDASFGDSDPLRLENQCNYMKEMGCNVEFKLYSGVGHQYTSEMIDDTFKFFSQYRYIGDGDIAPLGNRDGQVTVGDALVALRFALGLDIPMQQDIYHGDVAPQAENGQPNPDGQITVGDALVILRMALGLIMKIDGYPKEWSGITPSVIDPQGDGLCGANADIKSVCTTVDGNYAYVMVETYGKPINKDATLEIMVDYKPGQHSLSGLLDDLVLHISYLGFFALNDNDLDGNMEEYSITGCLERRGDVLEVKIPLSAIENATYFRPTFVNIWDYDYDILDPNTGCDPTPIQNLESE